MEILLLYFAFGRKKHNKKTPVLEGVKTKFIALIILFQLLCAVKILP